MKITVEQITSDPPFLRIGVVIHGPKDSWMRFALLRLDFKALPSELPRQILERRALEVGEDFEDDALPLDWE